MRALCIAALIWGAALPAWADARITVLFDHLQVRDVLSILADEGQEYGSLLDQDMLDNKGGAFWAAQVTRIYDQQRMEETLRRAFKEGLDDAAIEGALTFFGSEDGARIVLLENAARRAISDPAVEEVAREKYEELKGTDDPLMVLVDQYIEQNDLLEWNVSGAMTANYHFYKGLADGGYYARSEEEILDEVWSEQDMIREDTESWLGGYLLMSYQPLPLPVLEDYVAFSASEAGRALNAVLYEGFDTMYRDISYGLGRAISLMAQGDEI